MGNTTLEQADSARRKLRYRDALRLYRQEIADSPRSAEALQGAAYCLYELGKEADARTMCTLALEVDPKLALPHVVLAYIDHRHGAIDQSREEILQAVRLNPMSAEALCGYGILLLEDNELQNARTYLNKALEIDPEMYLAHYNLAVYFERTKDVHNLRLQARDMLRLKPGLANLTRLATVYVSTSRILFLAILLIPVVGMFLNIKALLALHMLLILMYLVGGLMMIRQRQSAIAYGNFGRALILVLLDTLLLVGFRQ